MNAAVSELHVIACGAVARELLALRAALPAADGLRLQCLPAELHNRPAAIVPALRAKLEVLREQALAAGAREPLRVLIGYGDCGTGGALDRLIERYDRPPLAVSRLPGAHCYAFYTGLQEFQDLAEEEPGTFFLTDFLARHFERLVWQGLGLDRHPELLGAYFGHYRRLIYLAQTENPALDAAAVLAARRLGLDYDRRHTAYGLLPGALARALA